MQHEPNQSPETGRTPHWALSIIPFAVLIAILVCVIRFFGADALGGGSQLALLIAAGVAAAIAMTVCRVPWKQIEEAVVENIRTVASAIIILLLIGAIAGSWMVSGVVPMLIYYGLKVLSPVIFLFAVCIICALVSVMTGSSWTTIATIGVALVGIGLALGFSPGWTAGAIISGAYFGDKISPLSDTTVLASSSCETPLFTHIRYMFITTVPSFSIACIVFLLVSIFHPKGDAVQVAEFSQAISSTFRITPWLFVVPLLTAVMIAKKMPALQTLFLSALLAGVTALIAQPEIVAQIGAADAPSTDGFGRMFRGLMITFYGSTSVETGSEALNELVQTRGINGMLSTVYLVLCAATFGGVLRGTGMIQSITSALTRRITGRTSLVGTTVATGIMANMVTGDQFLSIILTSSLFKKLYQDRGYENRLLSRTTEDSVTVTSVLIPWNSCGMTQSTVLKVPTVDYLPYCIFNILSPLMSIIVAAIGYKIVVSVKK